MFLGVPVKHMPDGRPDRMRPFNAAVAESGNLTYTENSCRVPARQAKWGEFLADAIKRITVRIGGMNYQLVSAENEQYTRQIAAKADEMIHRVMQNNPQLSLNMAAVLALVNAKDEICRISQQFSVLENQRAESERQQADTRRELSRMREQNWEMKKEILRLGALCRDYEALLARTAVPPARNSQGAEIDYSDDSAYVETAAAEEPGSTANPPADTAGPHPTGSTLPVGDSKLTQTNLDDYMRENGWPQPVEESKYGRQPE